MPIPLPNLDDRTYAELAAEAQSLIPGLCTAWTNHNASDPGIMLMELLAWLTEMTLFQLNEVPPKNIETFLGLLGWTRAQDQQTVDLEGAIRETLLALRKRYRAVTAADFEQLTREQWPETEAAVSLGDLGKIRRVRCVPQRDLAATDPTVRDNPAAAHVSIVIISDTVDPYVGPSAALRDKLDAFFQERCLLTTRHHVVGPSYVRVDVGAKLYLREDAPPERVLNTAVEALYAFFDPLHGGPERTGWPFGRDAYASEIYTLFDEIDLVDYVEGVRLSAPEAKAREQLDGDAVVAVTLDVHELIAIRVTDDLVAIDRNGNRYLSEALAVFGYSHFDDR